MRPRGIAVAVGAILLVLVLVAGLSLTRTTPGLDPRGGFHVVDGYNLGPETPCTAATHVEPSASLVGHYEYGSPDFCDVAVGVATPLLVTQAPRALIVGAAVAPLSCGDPYVGCQLTALGTPVLVVFDLANGSRRAFELWCMAPLWDGSTVQPATCGQVKLQGLPFYRASATPQG
jgi:hypothetical protein